MKTYRQYDFAKRVDFVFRRYGEKTAVVFYRTENEVIRYSYRQLSDITEDVRELLERQGIRPAERIAVLTKPTPFSAILLLALSRLGYTSVLPDASLPVEERNRLLKFTEPSAVFTTEDFCSTLDESFRKIIPVYRIFTDTEDCRQLNTELKERAQPGTPGDPDVIAIIFSSGTTGKAKGAEITCQAMMYAAISSRYYGSYSSSARFLHILPQNHIAGYTMLFINFLLGAEMGFVPEISAAGLAMGLRAYEPTHLTMIPQVYETIHHKIETEISRRTVPVRAAFAGARSFSSFVRRHTGYKMKWLTRPFYAPALGRNMHTMGSGTAACSEETVQFYLDLGIDFLNVYGATEASFPICATNCSKESYPDQGVGKAGQFPYIELRIEDGEILVRSALQMKGYFRDPESTRRSVTPDGFFRTGDLGYIDKQGNLHITGRQKETIQLKSGKKVSAADVDAYYRAVSGDLEIASCGVPEPETQTERVVLFLETADAPQDMVTEVKTRIRRCSDTTGGSYRLSEIICVKELPRTTLGKIQRFRLRELAEQQTDRGDFTPVDMEHENVCTIIQKHMPDHLVTPETRLSEDLNLDSLSMFEICSELESLYHVDFLNRLDTVHTVRDLNDLVNAALPSAHHVDTKQYPLPARPVDRSLFRILKGFSRNLYSLESVGTEQLHPDRQYIFCPNHESHLDSLWVWSALEGRLNCSRIACLAKQEHLDHAGSRAMLRILGGIPTDRDGNPVPAFQRAVSVIQRQNVQFLIHPEGTRTRNGALGVFKGGAAKLSLETGVPLVPVCILGAYQIFPADRLLPRFYDFRHRKRLPLKIVFGAPIFPTGEDTVASLTERLRREIISLRKMYEDGNHENRN